MSFRTIERNLIHHAGRIRFLSIVRNDTGSLFGCKTIVYPVQINVIFVIGNNLFDFLFESCGSPYFLAKVYSAQKSEGLF